MSGRLHGGDLAAADDEFGAPEDGWVDLSTGINPEPWPAAPEASDARRLPDRRQIARLRLAAAAAYGVPDPARLVAGPGSQALIQWLPRLRPPERVAVIASRRGVYGGLAPAWTSAGHEVVRTTRLADARDADSAVLARPNNPDGRVADRDELLDLARLLSGRGGQLVVDEAFADPDPSLSVADEAIPGLVVLRSFGKFFGLPGLRLGFAVADASTAAALEDALGPWPISPAAAEIGASALADAAWQEAARRRLARAAERLDRLLGGAGIEVVGGTPLFRLCRSARAGALHAALGRAGIYVRRFPEAGDLLRFGLPGPRGHWNRLERALRP